MKKGILLLFLAGILSGGVWAQEVPEIQKSLITKRTATWCPFCGGWGWTFFENLIEDNSANALLISAHYSGELVNPTAAAITANFNGISQPRFYLGNIDQGVSSGNAANKRLEIKEQVEANAANTPVVNSGIIATLDDNQVNLMVKTRFFEDTDGAYYVAPYIIENGVINYQSGQGNGAEHKNVLQAAFTQNHFGELVAEGNIASGTTIDQEFSLTLDTAWIIENIEIAVIIWKKEGDVYQFVNTNSTSSFESPTAVTDIQLKDVSMLVSPNLIADHAEVFISADRYFQEATLILSDISGRKLATIFQGSLAQGEQVFRLNRTDAGSSGLYLLSLISEDKTLTKKVIFR